MAATLIILLIATALFLCVPAYKFVVALLERSMSVTVTRTLTEKMVYFAFAVSLVSVITAFYVLALVVLHLNNSFNACGRTLLKCTLKGSWHVLLMAVVTCLAFAYIVSDV